MSDNKVDWLYCGICKADAIGTALASVEVDKISQNLQVVIVVQCDKCNNEIKSYSVRI